MKNFHWQDPILSLQDDLTFLDRQVLKEQSDQGHYCFAILSAAILSVAILSVAILSPFCLFPFCRHSVCCHSVCIFWMHYFMVKPHFSEFRIITAFFGVSECFFFFFFHSKIVSSSWLNVCQKVDFQNSIHVRNSSNLTVSFRRDRPGLTDSAQTAPPGNLF